MAFYKHRLRRYNGNTESFDTLHLESRATMILRYSNESESVQQTGEKATVETSLQALERDVGNIDISGKLDKPTNTTNGDLASFNSNGELVDSGVSASSLIDSETVRTKNTFLASPSTEDGAPSFRQISESDLPNISANKITSGTLSVSRGGTGKTSLTTGYFLTGNGTGEVALKSPDEVRIAISAAEASHSHNPADIGAATADHNHTKSDITDFAHNHTKSEISDFSHEHTKSDISDFDHTHTKSDITDFEHTHSYAGSTSVGGPANSVANSLTIGTKSYDGSNPVIVTADDFGISGAMTYIGKIKDGVVITDGSTTDPEIEGYDFSQAKNGDVIVDPVNSKEFIWNGECWEIFGPSGDFALAVHTHSKSDIIDFSHNHTKSEITDFAHNHTKSEISDFAHNHSKNDITDFPTTMTPTAHEHTVSEITDFPTSMTPTSHSHGNITDSGTITATATAIADGDSLAFVDSSNSDKVAKSSITFDGSTTSQYLSKAGTWVSVPDPYTHPTFTERSSGLYKFTVNNEGHVSDVTSVTKDDLTSIIGTIEGSDTKNTAGATDTSDKIYIVGATAQTANPQTYTQDTAYVGADGALYSNNKRVIDIQYGSAQPSDQLPGDIWFETLS